MVGGTRDKAQALLIDLDGVRRVGALAGGVGATVEGASAVDAVDRVLDFVAEVRAHGVPVGLVADLRSAVDGEPAALALAGAFDAVVDSAEPGSRKPAPAFFAAACLAVGTPTGRCLFVDEEDRSVRGARAAGLYAYRWNGPADLPYLRAALGVTPDRGETDVGQ